MKVGGASMGPSLEDIVLVITTQWGQQRGGHLLHSSPQGAIARRPGMLLDLLLPKIFVPGVLHSLNCCNKSQCVHLWAAFSPSPLGL